MILNKKDYDALYEELMLINEENYQGKFYVTNVKDLEEQALQFLIDENYIDEKDKDIDENLSLKISWKGEGMYCFSGLGFIHEYSLKNVIDLFETETEVSHKIFLGDHNEIEKAKSKFTNVYVEWNIDIFSQTFSIKEIIEDKKAINNSRSLSNKENSQQKNCEFESIKEMDNNTFYEFLKQYNKHLLTS
ncbi:hypothetical protein [Niallia sp. MER 6]|uniref:hypothetical protein n=1 Tax=Niallia sp. MER 6 TaxID=2939567 RepID=UPI00203C29DF|nr:hypothetical protein [Niallia sp. MER 6]MCM3031504.1 hypothetical protein [Niallia sp. MER 6]